MTANCKTHNKPRTVIYERKMRNGAMFSLVGCEDCAKAAAKSAGVKLTPKKEPKKETSGSRLRRI